MSNKFVFISCIVLLFYSCKRAEWAGRYKSTSCLTLEYVEFYQDNTADIKYFGSKTAVNHKLKMKDDLFYVNIYVFQLREDGKMYEMGGYDVGCILEKDKKHGFWQRVFQP
jgi:hypothetical protein